MRYLMPIICELGFLLAFVIGYEVLVHIERGYQKWKYRNIKSIDYDAVCRACVAISYAKRTDIKQ